MTEKTEVFVPKFFLVSEKQTICVSHRMTIGRREGDVVLEDTKLSSRHCDFFPVGLNLYVKDLNSTNGVYVNKQKILPNADIELTPGDIIRVGSYEFEYRDNDEGIIKESSVFVTSTPPPSNQDLFKFENLFSFFSVPKGWKGLYMIVFVLAIISFVSNFHLNISLPQNMLFLSDLYSQLIVFSGVTTLLIVWGLSLVHSFVVVAYLRKSYIAQAISAAAYLGALVMLVNFLDGPVWFVKQYAHDRDMILDTTGEHKAILELKKLVSMKDRLRSSHAETAKKLHIEDKKLLQADYDVVMKEVQKKIDLIKVPKKEEMKY